MSTTLAILTSDPTLLRCQVRLLKRHVRLEGGAQPAELGLGYVEADNVLLRKKPGDVGTLDLAAWTADVVSDVLLFHARFSGPETFAEEDAMPLRFRRWMFAQAGEPGAVNAVRAHLLKAAPDFLRRQVHGTTVAEASFVSFLAELRAEGRMDDFDAPAPLVARALGRAARAVERAQQAAGVPAPSGLNLVATNGRILVATRLAPGPLHYTLLEGIARCERCGIDERTPETQAGVTAHRRSRGVALATACEGETGFIEVPRGSAIAVDRRLDVKVAPIPP